MAGRHSRALAHVDRAYRMMERAGCFLTLPAAQRDEMSAADVRAVYARTLEAQRALIRAMALLAPDYRRGTYGASSVPWRG
jgi:hypothetical protein